MWEMMHGARLSFHLKLSYLVHFNNILLIKAFFFFLREKWERGGERNKLLEEQSRKLLLTRDGRLR